MPFDNTADVFDPSRKDGMDPLGELSPFALKKEGKGKSEESKSNEEKSSTDKVNGESKKGSSKEKTSQGEAKAEDKNSWGSLVNQVLDLMAVGHINLMLTPQDAVQKPADQGAVPSQVPNAAQIAQLAAQEIPNAPKEVQAAYAQKLAGQVQNQAMEAAIASHRKFSGTDVLSTNANPAVKQLGNQLNSLGQKLAEIENLKSTDAKVLPQVNWGQTIADSKGVIRPEILHAKIQALHTVLNSPQLANSVIVQQRGKFVINQGVLGQQEQAVLAVNPQLSPQDRAQANAIEGAARQVREKMLADSPFKTNDEVSAMANKLWQARNLLNANPPKMDEANALLDPTKANNDPFVGWWGNVRGPQGNGPIDKQILDSKIATLQAIYNPAIHGGQLAKLTDAINNNFLALAETRLQQGGLPIEQEAAYRAVLAYVHTQNYKSFDIGQGFTVADKRQNAIIYMANGLAAQMPNETAYK